MLGAVTEHKNLLPAQGVEGVRQVAVIGTDQRKTAVYEEQEGELDSGQLHRGESDLRALSACIPVVGMCFDWREIQSGKRARTRVMQALLDACIFHENKGGARAFSSLDRNVITICT